MKPIPEPVPVAAPSCHPVASWVREGPLLPSIIDLFGKGVATLAGFVHLNGELPAQ